LSERLTPIDERNAILRWRALNRSDVEQCLAMDQFGVLPCLNKLRVKELMRREADSANVHMSINEMTNDDAAASATESPQINAYLSDVLVEMAQKCDQLMELSRADEFFNEASQTKDPRALLAYGTHLYEKSRELERAEECIVEAVRLLDEKAFEDMSLSSFSNQVRKDKRNRRRKNQRQESLFLDFSKLSEEEAFKAHLIGAAWNNLGMIFKSKAVQSPENLDLGVMIMKCFQRAAYFGDPNGAFNTGMLFMAGRSSNTKYGSNYPLARKYFEHSDSVHSKLQLAKLSESGLCSGNGESEPDLREAFHFYKEALDMGYGYSRFLKQMLKLTYIVVMSNLFKNSRPGEIKK